MPFINAITQFYFHLFYLYYLYVFMYYKMSDFTRATVDFFKLLSLFDQKSKVIYFTMI